MRLFLNRTYKGSYTVEAALIMSISLFIIFYGMKLGIQLCREVRETSVYAKELEELSAVEIFWKINSIEEIWGNLNEDGV